jgi:hypothetical protein
MTLGVHVILPDETQSIQKRIFAAEKVRGT